MSLQKDKFKLELKAFILDTNQKEQKDIDKAIDVYAEKLETIVYQAIVSIDITIPSGAIQVTGGNSGGPVLCTNIVPLIIKGTIT